MFSKFVILNYCCSKRLKSDIMFPIKQVYNQQFSGFGGLEVACWPLVPTFAGSNPAEAVGFFGRKNPQCSFLRRGSKAVGPMS